MKNKILIVEDEIDIRQMMCFSLKNFGYDVVEAGEAESVRAKIFENQPDLILMDWMLPGMSGVELTRVLKSDAATRDIPVIMVTAKGEEEDKIRGFDCGAEDYITKPFSPREMSARIKAVLRRVSPHTSEAVVTFAGLNLDPQKVLVTFESETISLGPTEFKLLHYFMTHAENVHSRAKLLDRVWGTNAYIEERTVDVHIRRLRKSLSTCNLESMIETVRGNGYRLTSNSL